MIILKSLSTTFEMRNIFWGLAMSLANIGSSLKPTRTIAEHEVLALIAPPICNTLNF